MINFEATLKMLSKRGVNFVVIGGYAATLHGSALDAISMPLFGGEYRVASLDSLIRSKRAAGRSKDLNVLPEPEALKEMHAPKEQWKPPQD